MKNATRHGRLSALFACVLLATIFLACADLPRDVDGSLREARGGSLRVGVTPAPPWIVPAGGERSSAGPAGPEAALIRSFAAGIDAEVDWVWGGAEENLSRLERGELDVVAAGLTRTSPWRARVALTRPHTVVGKDRHVLAAAPGENALLVALERHIERRP